MTSSARSGDPSHVAVFGATGLLGSECAYQLLQKGHKVTAFCRDPQKLKTPLGSTGNADNPLVDPKLSVVQGTVTSKSDVDKVFMGEDINGVIVVLGGRTSRVGPTMLSEGTANIIEAMKEKGVKRIAAVTSLGIDHVPHDSVLYERLILPHCRLWD
eukprot:452551_1